MIKRQIYKKFTNLSEKELMQKTITKLMSEMMS